MRIRSRLHWACILGLVMRAAPPPLRASTFQWTGADNLNPAWNNPANWAVQVGFGFFPDAPDDVAQFTAISSAAASVTLGQAITVGQILFGTSHNVTISPGGASGHLTFASVSNTPIVINAGTGGFQNSGADTISAPITLNANFTVDVDNSAALTLSGVISATAAAVGISKFGLSTAILSGTNTYSGVTSVYGGVLSVGASSNLGNASATNNLVFGANGGGGTLLTTGPIFSPSRTVALNSGIFDAGTIDTGGFNSTLGAVDGTGAFIKRGAGTLTVAHVVSGNLTVMNGGTLAMTPNSAAAGVSHVATLAMGSSAKLDLASNKLITTSAVGSATAGVYNGVTGLIQTGRNGGGWNASSGILTSSGSSNLTSIGIATAQQVKGLANPGDNAMWAGQTVKGSETLVMYTYGGDATLDGKINVDDYGRIDFNASLPNAAAWFNGDFNYDGKINVDDYGIIDFNVGIQGAPFPTGSSLNNITAVPEPATFALAAPFAIAMLARRRRSRWRGTKAASRS